ncbi:MAG: ATP-dependent sacrificial sulfur transferase LarE, partial [Acidimicrobiales bacterium]
MRAKLDALRGEIASLSRVVVAFSGGADSALVASVANGVLGAGALSVTAVSPSLAPEELADCRALASEWQLRWETVETTELADEQYARNGTDRCYRCKANLMEALGPLAETEGAT